MGTPGGLWSYTKGSTNPYLPTSPLPSPSLQSHECAEGKAEMFYITSALPFYNLENGQGRTHGGRKKNLIALSRQFVAGGGGGFPQNV